MHLSTPERALLERALRGVVAGVPAHRAAILLACAEGKSNRAVAAQVGATANTVGLWRQRFLRLGAEGLRDVPHRLGVRPLDAAQIEEVLRLLRTGRPGGGAWTTASLAAATGLSASSVSRIRRAFGHPLRLGSDEHDPDGTR